MHVHVVTTLLITFLGHVAAHGGLANYTVGDTWYRG
jgi:hypothetical protein